MKRPWGESLFDSSLERVIAGGALGGNLADALEVVEAGGWVGVAVQGVGGVLVVLDGAVGDAGGVGEAGVVTGLGDGVGFDGDLIMPAEGTDVADASDDLRGEFALDGQLEVFRVGRAEIGAGLAELKRSEVAEVNRRPRGGKSEGEAVQVTGLVSGDVEVIEGVSKLGVGGVGVVDRTVRRDGIGWISEVLEGGFLFGAVVVKAEAAADGELFGVAPGEQAKVRSVGEAEARTYVEVLGGGAAGVVTAGVAGEVEIKRGGGEDFGLLSGDEAGDADAVVLEVHQGGVRSGIRHRRRW